MTARISQIDNLLLFLWLELLLTDLERYSLVCLNGLLLLLIMVPRPQISITRG